MRYSLLLLVAMAGVAAGAAVMLVVGAPATDIKAADWLQFAGAMIGVIFAIWGALAVEHWRQREAEGKEELLLLTSMIALLQAAKKFDTIVEYNEDFEDFVPQAQNAVSSLEDAKDMIALVSSSAKVRDLKLWRNIRFVERKIKEHELLYDPQRDILRSDQDLERIYNSFQIWVREIEPVATRIVSGLERRRALA